MDGAALPGNELPGQTRPIDFLRHLLERLGSPDLTLPEARCLRVRIHQLLGEVNPDQHLPEVFP